MEAQEESSQEQDALAGDVMGSMGESHEGGEEGNSSESSENKSNDPLYVQKRLKQQKRAHDREVRDLHARIGDLQSRFENPSTQSHEMSPYEAGGQTGGVDEQIHKAVSYALRHRDMEEHKAKEAEKMAHVHRQYQELDHHLDSASDKYDDFDDVVRGRDIHFTPHMRDAALLLPKKGDGSAAEVLYKLGKNPEELKRIAQLHALDQAAEMVRMSHALIGGSAAKASSSGRPLGQIKSNPVTNTRAVTENTSVSDLRKRMKSGWK